MAFKVALMGAVSARRLHTLHLGRPATLPPPPRLPALRSLDINFTREFQGPAYDDVFVDSVLTRYEGV